jgi:hypothetical protein
MENIFFFKIINYIIYRIPQIKMREFHLPELESFKENPLDEYFSEGKHNFPLSYILKSLAKKMKLFGQTTNIPIFNLITKFFI